MEPSNADLQKSFEEHAKLDAVEHEANRAFREAQAIVNEEAAKSRKSIHEALEHVATKNDLKSLEKSVRGVVHLQKNLIIAGDIASLGGKWGYRAILVLASLMTALGIIFGGWKLIFAFIFGKSI